MSIQIAPSILSADFCNLERDLKAIANADLVHVDVMDHHFVPNLTLGEPIVKRICEVTDLPVDVHLMIEDPDRWAPEYAKLGAASISFHMGATHAPVRLARQLTCWSPAPPCTALRARPRPSTRSGTRPLPHTATDGGNAEHGTRRLRHQCRTAIVATPSSASTMHNLKGHIS